MASCGAGTWLDWFDYIWLVTSMEGHCDALHGQQYVRVRWEWIASGSPGLNPVSSAATRQFIIDRANAPPLAAAARTGGRA